MSELADVPSPSWADPEPVPDALREQHEHVPGREPRNAREEAMERITARREEAFRDELRRGMTERERALGDRPAAAPEPAAAPARAPNAPAPPAMHVLDLGNARVAVTNEQAIALAQDGARLPGNSAALQQLHALETVGTEYSDVFADNSLSQLAAVKAVEAAIKAHGAGKPMTMLESYRAGCEGARAVLRSRKPDPARAVPARRAPEQRPESNASAIIARMRAERGQHV